MAQKKYKLNIDFGVFKKDSEMQGRTGINSSLYYQLSKINEDYSDTLIDISELDIEVFEEQGIISEIQEKEFTEQERDEFAVGFCAYMHGFGGKKSKEEYLQDFKQQKANKKEIETK